jgi:hypothetical protein
VLPQLGIALAAGYVGRLLALYFSFCGFLFLLVAFLVLYLDIFAGAREKQKGKHYQQADHYILHKFASVYFTVAVCAYYIASESGSPSPVFHLSPSKASEMRM